MSPFDKPLAWLGVQLSSPPLSEKARKEVGLLLRRLQQGESLGLPASRPMPSVGPRCHELRFRDAYHSWRLIYRIDHDAIVVVALVSKKTEQTPDRVIELSRDRLRRHDLRGGESRT